MGEVVVVGEDVPVSGVVVAGQEAVHVLVHTALGVGHTIPHTVGGVEGWLQGGREEIQKRGGGSS